ncbi:protein disulfide isomerase-like 2-2 [Actinidia eriantha]|uniref:protein disulfide isomerase-like 2-2 n=1 Tax=Actinidia eriantha TaxID=165200 RepID=UPI002587CA97|nr:protein disulfide isomerase-like 2-2 [Actinidia eriantha]
MVMVLLEFSQDAELLKSGLDPSILFVPIYLLSTFLFRYGKIYLKAATSCLENGGDYAKSEIQCPERMLNEAINAVKTDEFTLMKNILSIFIQNTPRGIISLELHCSRVLILPSFSFSLGT